MTEFVLFLCSLTSTYGKIAARSHISSRCRLSCRPVCGRQCYIEQLSIEDEDEILKVIEQCLLVDEGSL